MKELKPRITDIRANSRSRNDRRLASRKSSGFTNKVESCKPSPLPHSLAPKARAIAPLQPQLALEQSLPAQKSGWQRLAGQAELINKLAAELEEAMCELKAIAHDINCNRRKQNTQKPIKHACEYLAAIVPHVKYKTGAFVLTTRPVDLFRAEREATQLAKTLRNRAKRRVSPLSRRNKHPLLSWLS
jgi:hypothetical protein